MSEFIDGVMEELCWETKKFLVLFVLLGVALLITLPSVFLFDLSRATRIIAIINLAGILALMAVSGAVLVKCYRM